MEKVRKKRVKKEEIGYGYNSVFPTQLRELLKSRDITQDKLAEVVEVSRQSVAQWKDGKTMPDIYYLKKIADFFVVSYEYLLDGVSAEKKENVEINKRLGLKEEAIYNLEVGFTNYDNYKVIADKFIGHEKFPYFINSIITYINNINKFASKSLKEQFSDRLKALRSVHREIFDYNASSEDIINGSAYKTNEIVGEIIKSLVEKEVALNTVINESKLPKEGDGNAEHNKD